MRKGKGEFSAMDESLTEQCRVSDEGFRIVKLCEGRCSVRLQLRGGRRVQTWDGTRTQQVQGRRV